MTPQANNSCRQTRTRGPPDQWRARERLSIDAVCGAQAQTTPTHLSEWQTAATLVNTTRSFGATKRIASAETTTSLLETRRRIDYWRAGLGRAFVRAGASFVAALVVAPSV